MYEHVELHPVKRGVLRRLLPLVVVVSLTGCLATIVQTPSRGGQELSTTRVHILALPNVIDVPECKSGLARVESWVPVWGLAIGILTFGIIVPVTTTFSCAEG